MKVFVIEVYGESMIVSTNLSHDDLVRKLERMGYNVSSITEWKQRSDSEFTASQGMVLIFEEPK